MTIKGKRLLASLLVLMAAVAPLFAGTDSELPIEPGRATVEGGSRSPVRITPGITDEGESLEVRLPHSDGYPQVRFPVDQPTEGFFTLCFKVRFHGTVRNFGVLVSDSAGVWNRVEFKSRSRKLEDGWYEFSWDTVNQPGVDRGADLSALRQVAFKFALNEIPEGTEELLTFKNLRFVAWQGVTAGDPALFKKWKDYAKSYRPDYSDSTWALLPPKTGRLETPLALVSSGKALGEILLPLNASEVEQNAGKELQHWFEKISGVRLPILTEASRTKNVKLFLGRDLSSATCKDDVEKLGSTDGFAVRTNGNNIHIFGATPKGTLNGVFAFIENNTDIIWARPHFDYGTVFSKTPDIVIRWGNALELPATRLRGWLPNAGGSPDAFARWLTRNRGNQGIVPSEWGGTVEIGGGHNLQSFIPKNDPAFYPVIKGKKPEKLSIWKHQICLSVPDLENIYADNVLKFLREKAPQGIDIVNIKIEDNWGVCECEQCLAPITLPNGETLPSTDDAFRSTQFFRFLNRVTENINKVYPNLRVQTYAYFYTAIPPKVPLNNNIQILFCPYVRKDHRTPMFSPVNDHWWKMQTEWARATPNVVVREYYGILNEGRPLAEVAAADIRSKLAQGINCFTAEVNDDDNRLWWDGVVRGAGDEYDVNMMEHWVTQRLYWSPDADVEALRKYFIRRTFHEAAPEIERVFGMIREDWFTQRGSSTWGAGVLHRAFTASGREAEVRELLDTALRKVKNPTARILTARLKERIETAFLPEKPIPFERAQEINGEKFFPATGLLTYGWGLPAYRTTVEREGSFKDGIRVRFTKNTPIAATRPFLTDLSNRTIQFHMVRSVASPNIDPATLPKLRIIQGNHRENAPDYLTNPDGSFTLEWTPEASTMNLSQINRFEFIYPESQLSEDEFDEFLLTDIRVTENEPNRRTSKP